MAKIIFTINVWSIYIYFLYHLVKQEALTCLNGNSSLECLCPSGFSLNKVSHLCEGIISLVSQSH